MDNIRISLPWPPAKLSANARGHWASLYGVKKKFKNDCHYIAKTVRPVFYETEIKLSVTFVPPGAYRYDEDNLIGRMKYGFDGIALAWGVNDERFRVKYQRGAPVKPGAVIVEILNEGQGEI